MQRVKVGVIGLATVLLLIGLSPRRSLRSSAANGPGTAIGAPNANVAANLTMANGAAPVTAPTSEPLAELGVAPAASPTPLKP